MEKILEINSESYNRQIELSNYIIKKIKNIYGKFTLKLNYNELKNFNNIFFNELIIDFNLNENIYSVTGVSLNNINTTTNSLEEIYNYDSSTDRLKTINISISSNSNNVPEIKMKLCDLLNHLYVYWNTIRDGFNEQQKNNYTEYSNILYEWIKNVY